MKKTFCIVLGIGFLLAGCSRSPGQYLERGNKYLAEEKYNEAILEYKNALKKDPRFAEAHYQIGIANLRQGYIEEGGQSILQALLTSIIPTQTCCW